MKTLAAWNADPSEPTLTEYLQPCDEIDEELFYHMAGVVFPQYSSRELLQSGEAEHERYGVYFYLSFMRRTDGRYFYLGILPEFKQE